MSESSEQMTDSIDTTVENEVSSPSLPSYEENKSPLPAKPSKPAPVIERKVPQKPSKMAPKPVSPKRKHPQEGTSEVAVTSPPNKPSKPKPKNLPPPPATAPPMAPPPPPKKPAPKFEPNNTTHVIPTKCQVPMSQKPKTLNNSDSQLSVKKANTTSESEEHSEEKSEEQAAPMVAPPPIAPPPPRKTYMHQKLSNVGGAERNTLGTSTNKPKAPPLSILAVPDFDINTGEEIHPAPPRPSFNSINQANRPIQFQRPNAEIERSKSIPVPQPPVVEDKKKKEKKKFGLFKKKDAKMDDFEISEPTDFSKTLGVSITSGDNALSKFESKEQAMIPLQPPLPLLNKKRVKSQEEYDTLVKEMKDMQLFFDDWSSPIVPVEKWLMKYSEGWSKKSLIFEQSIEEGYNIEIGEGAVSNDTDLRNYFFVDITSDFRYFERFIAGNPEVEHYVLTNEPTSLSIIPAEGNGFRRALMMSKKGYIRLLLPHDVTKIKEFKKVFPDTSNGDFFKVTDDLTFEHEMVKYEQMAMISHYKFGMLYIKANQTDENEMFSNTEGSPAFEKFMKLIATKVELLGFDGYRGGLDVKTGTTGEYSYFTKFYCYDVMFHVSTLLPNQPDDLQRVEKKRHIGNDIVVILFKENGGGDDDKFDPKWLTSQFNHIFIVVRPDKNDETNSGYTVTVGCKSSVNPFPPFMRTSHYNHDDNFRDFILRKAINGERTAMFSPAFKGNAVKLRKDQLSLLFKNIKH